MKPWTNHEVRNLRDMVAAGVTDDRAISQYIGRSRKSVQYKRYELRMFYPRRTLTVVPARSPPQKETLTISKADLIEYYGLGWRVTWFDGNQVGVER